MQVHVFPCATCLRCGRSASQPSSILLLASYMQHKQCRFTSRWHAVPLQSGLPPLQATLPPYPIPVDIALEAKCLYQEMLQLGIRPEPRHLHYLMDCQVRRTLKEDLPSTEAMHVRVDMQHASSVCTDACLTHHSMDCKEQQARRCKVIMHSMSCRLIHIVIEVEGECMLGCPAVRLNFW